MSLVGKNIIITGATSGLGVDMAAALSSEGAAVFIGGRRSDLGEKVAQTTKSTFHLVDVADEESNRTFFEAAEKHFGGQTVDYIFLNAGVEGNPSEMVAGTESFSIKAYDYIFSVNVRGIALGLQFGTKLLRTGGTFVLTSSGASVVPLSSNPFYAASKSTVDALARSFAAQFAESKDDLIRSLSVVTINPLVYATDMALRFAGSNDTMEYFATLMNPSKRAGKGSELGKLVVEFARGDLPYKSGDSIVLDADTHFPLQELSDRMKASQATDSVGSASSE